MSLPSNPLPRTLEPYQRHPYCKLPDPEHRQWADDQADYRGLKDHTHGVRHSSKFPRYPVGRAERNPASTCDAHDNRKPGYWHRHYGAMGIRGQEVIERFYWFDGELIKTKPSSPWTPPRPRA